MRLAVDLARAVAYSNKTPYDLWQESEGIPILRGHCVEDLTAIPVAPWKRTGVRGSLINLVGSGRTCGAYVLEIPPRSETQPQRDLFARPALFSPITAGEHLETKRKENIRSGYEN
jgi:hypothetical protein